MGPVMQITIGSNVSGAVAGLNSLGDAADHTFDEIAAGAAAMARIEAAIEAAAAAARNAGTALQLIGQNAITSITPLNTLEARLHDIRDAIGRSATVQGAANLGAQYEVINRNLEQTRNQITAATNAAVGLGNAFNSIAGAGAGLNRLAPAIRPVLTNLTLIPPAANAAAASLARVRGGAGPAGVALTDFSRIVQDAPFGIIGIGNNITQLSESFGRLRASAGSTGAAFRQLFTSAGGFGGIGLAISLITTALTFASVGFGAWTRGLSGTKKATEDAKKATEDFVKSLKTVSDVVNEATGSQQGQIAQVQALANVVTDSNNSYKERNRALQELSQINKNYFGDLKLEESQMGLLTARVNEYTQALVAQAILKGFIAEIGRVAPELAKQNTSLDAARIKMRRLQDQLAGTKSEIVDLRGNVQSNPVFTKLLKETRQAEKAFNDQRKAVEDVATNMAQLKGQIQGAVDATLQFKDLTNSSAGASKEETDALKRRIDALKELRDTLGLTTVQQRELVQLEVQLLRRDGIKLGFTPQEIEDRVQQLIQSTRFGREANGIPVSIPLLIRPRPVIDVEGAILPGDIADGAFDGVVKAIQENAAVKLAALQNDLATQIQNTITNGAIEGLASVGDTLGQAIGSIFSGKGFGAALAAGAESLLKIIGGVMQDVGKQLIATSVLVQALKAALKTLFANPAGGLAVGIALVALGGLLKSIKFDVPGFADGVTGFPGGLALVGERGPELVNLPRGADVIPNNQLGSFGGQQVFIPSTVIRGEDIYISYNRVGGRRRRI